MQCLRRAAHLSEACLQCLEDVAGGEVGGRDHVAVHDRAEGVRALRAAVAVVDRVERPARLPAERGHVVAQPVEPHVCVLHVVSVALQRVLARQRHRHHPAGRTATAGRTLCGACLCSHLELLNGRHQDDQQFGGRGIQRIGNEQW